MGTVEDKLGRLSETKELLKQRLTEKGVNVSNENVFYNLADKVGSVATGPEKTNLEIYPVAYADYIIVFGVFGGICTASQFGSENLDCYIGEQLLITSSKVEDMVNCEIIPRDEIYTGGTPLESYFRYFNVLKITGKNPSVKILL